MREGLTREGLTYSSTRYSTPSKWTRVVFCYSTTHLILFPHDDVTG